MKEIDIAAQAGYKKTEGAFVGRVPADGPAAAAGITPGDIVLQFDGKKIKDARALIDAITAHKVGQTVEVVVWRAKKEVRINLTLGELPPDRR